MEENQGGYPIAHNWRDLIDENTTVYFDSDQLTYINSSAAESRTVKITNNKTEEVFKCKNRTEFFGAKKKIIEGRLGDINILRESKGLEPFAREDFTIEDIQEAEPVEYLYYSLKQKIKAELEYLGLTKYVCVLGGEGNPRLSLDMPFQYKSSRKDLIKPLLLNDARNYIINYHKGYIVNGMETDEFLTTKGYEGYQHYLKTGKFSNIIISIDKDGYSTPSLIFNNYRNEGKLKHKDLHLVDNSIGELFLEGKKIHGWGFKWLCWQCLMADPTDGFYSYQKFEHIKFGERTAYSLLLPLTTQQECLQVVVDTYKSWFPEPFKFISWTGKEIESDWLKWLETIFACAYMKRIPNDKTTIERLLKHYKVNY